jgi:flagellar hook-length control protein FliK
LFSQLSGQLTSLRQLPHGEHVLTLTVNPETFGPVRVIAHITHDGVSLQLFGASDQARAALKDALPDLRRDLAGTGLQSSLELGSGSGSGSGGREAMGDPSSFAGNGNAPQRAPRPDFGGSVAAVTPAANHTNQATRRGGLDLVL